MAVRILSRRKSFSGSGFLGVGLILCGLVVAAALFVQARSTPKLIEKVNPIVVGDYDYVNLPVPAKFVPVGTKIKDIPLSSTRLPKHQAPQGALVSLDRFMEAVTIAPLPANVPFFEDNFSFTQAGNPVIERIPAGMRAMTIQVDATSAVEGWAGSGALVDVILVGKDRTTVIAEKVRILSAERSVQPIQNTNSPSVPRTITILVTQEQCLAINTAIPKGKIALALRSSNDEESWSRPSFSADSLNNPGARDRGERSKTVNGVIKITEQAGTSAYVLMDGKWVSSQRLPDGFLLSEPRAVQTQGATPPAVTEIKEE